MKKKLLLFALGLWSLHAYPQITTFNYATSGLSTTSCNVFYPAVNVEGSDGLQYLHTTMTSAPQFNGTAVGLHDAYITWEEPPTVEFAESYAITYPFKSGYTYSLSLNVLQNINSEEVGVGVTTGCTNTMYIGLGSSIPWTSGASACAGDNLDPFHNPYAAIYSTTFTNMTSSTTITVPNFASTASYLFIGAWPGTMSANTNSFLSTLFVNSITIRAIPNITPAVNYICSTSTPQTYSIPGSAQATWSVSPAGIVQITPNGNSVSVVKESEGNCVLTATINGNVTSSINISTQPTITNVTATLSGSCQDGYQDWLLAAIPNAPNSTNWQWTATHSNGDYYITSPNSATTSAEVDGGLGLAVAFSDACGIRSATNGTTIYSNCNEPEAVQFQAIPNPAGAQVTITPNTQRLRGEITPLSSIREIKIFDALGRLRSDVNYGTGVTQKQVDVSKLENGVYFLVLYMNGNKQERKKILVRH